MLDIDGIPAIIRLYVTVHFRYMGGVICLRESDIDISTLYIESWFNSSGGVVK